MRLWIGCLLFFVCQAIFAAPPVATSALHSTQNVFDVKDANKQFDKLNIELSTQNLNLNTLTHAVNVLNKLINRATDCIDTNEKRLSVIDEQIHQTTPAHPLATDSSKSDADLIYLNTERKKLTTQLAQCRLFSIRANEAVDAYGTAAAKLKHEETFTRGLPFWLIIDEIKNLPQEAPSLTLNIPWSEPPLSWGVFGTMTGISLLLSYVLIMVLHRSKRIRRYFRIRTFKCSTFVLLSLCLLFAMVDLVTKTKFSLHLISFLLVFTLGLLGITLLFTIKRVRAFFYWYSLDCQFFESLAFFLFSFYAIAFLSKILAMHMTLHTLFWQLGETLFLLAVLMTAIGFIVYFCKEHRHIPFIKKHHRFIKRISALLFIACGAIDILGYHTLAMHLTYSGITTFAVIFCAGLLEQAISKLYLASAQHGAWHPKIMHLFGYKPHQTPTELYLLKITLQLWIFGAAIYLIAHSWGYANDYVENIYHEFLFGIHFATFTFYPTRIIAGIMVFCILYLLCRSLSSTLSRHDQFEDEEETQVALASILSYVGFAVAILAGLLTAGFDFTGLAIIAGALSVGIGLGLQSIVNNFVSGLILLIEKPIKPGDRIHVDNVEGIVKKIRVRSTQITTSAREDVIIPNSDLITRPVTNYMYSDKYLSIHSEVRVTYGHDPQLIRELLLQVVQKHDDIVNTARNKPTVLLHAFGENALIFQVWFLIKDGNRKSNVQSDVHFGIERVFREHGIQFAFPQRDIHIKLSEIKALSPDI